MNLLAGEHKDRFYVVFRPDAVLSIPEKDWLAFDLKYFSKSHEVVVQLPNSISSDRAYLYNLLGQQVQEWDSRSLGPQNGAIRIPIQAIDEGLYLFVIHTDQGLKQLKFLFDY